MRDECFRLLGVGAFIKNKQKATDVCNWRQDNTYSHWKGDCQIAFYLEEGNPSQNGMKFCCGCGKKLVEHEWQDETKEDNIEYRF